MSFRQILNKQSKNLLSLLMIASVSVSATAATTQATTQSTSTATSAVLAPAPLVTFSLKIDSSQKAKTFNEVGGLKTDNQLKAIYNISPNLGTGVLVGGYYDFADRTQNQSDLKSREADLALVVTGKTAGFAGADLTAIEGRLYLPTSLSSRKNGQSSKLRMDITLPKNLGNGYSASLYFRPNYITMQTGSLYSSYFESLSSIKGAYNFTKEFDVYASLDHTYNSFDQTIKTAKEGLGPQIGMNYKFNPYFKLTVDAEQTRNINAPSVFSKSSKYALFDANETVYRFTGVVTY